MTTTDDLEQALTASQEQPIVIFKHSTSCPFSARAQEQVANAKHDIEVYGLVVQYARDLSEAVAEKLDVEHASPQAIVVHKGKAVDKYWRSEIREGTLTERVKELA